jgi:alkylation response protein AidB-like acyl-CoA dehydrogenase
MYAREVSPTLSTAERLTANSELFAKRAIASDFLDQVREIAVGELAACAEKIDREAFYPKQILQSIGATGAMACHLDRHGQNFAHAIEAMSICGAVCGSTGFMMWCHDVCGLYMEQSANPALTGSALDRHAWAHTLGGTGMSNPMKTFAGIETLLLRARREGSGYRISGTLPWVSHIGPDHYLGAVCAVQDSSGQSTHEVMFLLDCSAPGVTLKHCPTFSGMEGTSTWAVALKDVWVGEDRIIADPVRPFIGRIRASFVLLQTGMGLGVTRGSIASMHDVEGQLGKVNQFLDDRPDDLQAELDELTARIMHLAATPFETDTEFLIDVLDSRAQVSELSLRAAQSALLHQGARGYLMSAAPQRRIRESHFVAIVTPAIKHLRKEIARLMSEQQPG